MVHPLFGRNGLVRPKALSALRPLRTIEFIRNDSGAAKKHLPRRRRRMGAVTTRLYGTRFLLIERALRMTAEEVAMAAQSFAPLEVTYVWGARPKRLPQ